ncbi:RNA polymerase sigma factor [Tellurirhabdus rosea]|uniref:RNA polymerase sigma factor n=1 Tax=Tellurirhabdus rosea TaxID=2674997 RepID=UPI00224F3A88|nr:RNA polymerase sigma factor [Tellurirhabdus rosea]
MVSKSIDSKRMSDEELVSLYMSTQNNYYFDRLYERYSNKVYRKCLTFTKDKARAEDFTHDIFLRLIMRLGSYRGQSQFSVWLYSITYNYCTDQLRIVKRQGEVAIDENMDWSEDNEAELAEMEVRRLKSAMQGIAADEKAILLMKYQDGLSIKDIAAIQKVTESAVKMRLKRAKERLRQRYLETLLFWLVLFAKLMTLLKWPIR